MDYRIQRLKEDLTNAQRRNKNQRIQLANYKKAYEKKFKENINLKQALNEIKIYCKKINHLFWVEDDEPKYVSRDILQIANKHLGGNEE